LSDTVTYEEWDIITFFNTGKNAPFIDGGIKSLIVFKFNLQN